MPPLCDCDCVTCHPSKHQACKECPLECNNVHSKSIHHFHQLSRGSATMLYIYIQYCVPLSTLMHLPVQCPASCQPSPWAPAPVALGAPHEGTSTR